jgi:hypothetical protein
MKNDTQIRYGFKLPDEYLLKKYDNASANPHTQIFSYEKMEEEESENTKYYCAMCRSRLKLMPRLEIWQCGNCLETYDTKYLQDSVLKSIGDFKLTPHFAFQRYPTFDENDPHKQTSVITALIL